MKYVAIKNQELAISSIDGNLVDIIIELCETISCYNCYFNKDKWFTLLQHLSLRVDVTQICTNYVDLTKFYLYGAEWFEYFQIKNNKLCPYNLRPNNFLQQSKHLKPGVIFISFVVYTSSRKNVREKLDVIRDYKNVYDHVILAQNIANLDKSLPKGWKDNLSKLNSYLDNLNLFVNYLNLVDFAQQINTTRTINRYVKKYGKKFITFLEENVVDLNNDEEVDNKMFIYLRQNNKLLIDPLACPNNLLGEWVVVELCTPLAFVEESEVQNHCIGRGDYYINQVKGGNLRAFSFRKNIGKESRYTVTYVKEGNRWEVEQDKGRCNYDKTKLYDSYNVKCLEINMERVKQVLDKSSKDEKFF